MTDTDSQFPLTYAAFEHGLDRKLHHGLQIYISRGGECLLDAAWGRKHSEFGSSASDGSASQFDIDDLALWMSAGKPLLAVAVARLVLSGQARWESRVGEFIPDFVASPLTIQHLVTHTSGLPILENDWRTSDWDVIISQIAGQAFDMAGERAAYSPQANWFVLGEVLSRAHDAPFADALRDLVLQPCGLFNTFNGMSPSEFADRQERLIPIFLRERGELKEDPQFGPETARFSSPGGNWRGPIQELGWFYESLLGYRSTLEIAATEWAAIRKELLQPQRVAEVDATFRHVIDFGRGVILNSNQYGIDTVPYGYGQHATASAIGHGGSQCSIGFVDPEHELVVAWAANGRPGEGQHQRRNRALNDAIYQDLGLA